LKEKDPKYQQSTRNKKIATRCRVCGKQLTNIIEIENECHIICDKDNENVYMM
tara:strand:- start:373 stop:531 length:159 start_codon:yes stop_codon:yes gene_type:complete